MWSPRRRANCRGLLHGDVDVVLAGEIAVDPDEAVALVAQVQEALDLGRLAGEAVVGSVGALARRRVAVATTAAPTTLALFALGGLGRFRHRGRGDVVGDGGNGVRGRGGLGRRRGGGRAGVLHRCRVLPGGLRPAGGGATGATGPGRRLRRLLALGRGDRRLARVDRLGRIGGGRPRSGSRRRRGDPGQLEDQVDDVGLLGPGAGLATEGGGDGHELVAILAFERRSFELLGLRAHVCGPRGGRRGRWPRTPSGATAGREGGLVG